MTKGESLDFELCKSPLLTCGLLHVVPRFLTIVKKDRLRLLSKHKRPSSLIYYQEDLVIFFVFRLFRFFLVFVLFVVGENGTITCSEYP